MSLAYSSVFPSPQHPENSVVDWLVERGGRDEHAPRDGAPALEHERECRVGEVCLLDLAEDVLEVLLDVGDESDKDVRAKMRGRLAWEDDGTGI